MGNLGVQQGLGQMVAAHLPEVGGGELLETSRCGIPSELLLLVLLVLVLVLVLLMVLVRLQVLR